jgi:hypothetical protein
MNGNYITYMRSRYRSAKMPLSVNHKTRQKKRKIMLFGSSNSMVALATGYHITTFPLSHQGTNRIPPLPTATVSQ